MGQSVFVLGGIVAVAEAAVLGLVGTAFGPPETPIVAGLCGYFAFALGGALLLFPILLLVVPVGLFVAFYLAGPYLLYLMVAHTVVTSVVMIVGGVAATHLAFSRRAHRLNAHIGRSTTVRAMPRQAPPLSHVLRRRFQGTLPRAHRRATPIGRSAVRAALAIDGVEQSFWGGVFGSVAAVLLLAFPRLLPGPLGVPGAFQIFWPVALAATFAGGWRRSMSYRQRLPWSRRQHRRVTLLLHVWTAVTLVGVPAAVAATYCAFRTPDLFGISLRVAATFAIAFPALSWLGLGFSPLSATLGGTRRLVAVGAVSVALALTLQSAVRDVPVLVPSALGQLAVAAAAAAITWTAHWYALRGYFATRDLVGNEGFGVWGLGLGAWDLGLGTWDLGL
ncbi:MAG: hypothetical protein Q7V01_00365, partial [Vicinamibacterales bacterium]|nr:hypothetical protein [Vicinamibacterales bacterium]